MQPSSCRARTFCVLVLVWLLGVAAPQAMAVTVSAGHSHTCGISAANAALCWGSNAAGELGDGTRTDREGPVAVQGLGAMAALDIRAGRGFSCALLEDRSVHCWGRITASATAQPMQGVPPALQLSAGASHACALTVQGEVYCWGDASRGQRGPDGAVGTAPSPGLPTRLAALSGPSVSRIVAAGDATCAVSGGIGHVVCVGTADWLPAPQADPGQPRPLPGVADALDLAAHEGHACILRRAGEVACWGRNGSGQVGTPASSSLVSAPVDVAGLQPALAISAGEGVSCAVQVTRLVRCWGAQALLGAGNDKTPRWMGQVVGITDAVLVSAGGTHACAMLEGGYVQCWGSNAQGQLGGGGLCNAHLAMYFNYTDSSPIFNMGPCYPYSAGITPHGVKGFDMRSDADLVMEWAERSLPAMFSMGYGLSFYSQSGYFFRPYAGDRTLAVTSNGTPHVFFVGPETGGNWVNLGHLTHWVRQAR